MKNRTQNLIAALAWLALSTLNFHPSTVLAQSTAFTYQGRLNDGENTANGIYDLRFAIYDLLTSGTQQGVLVTNAATTVSNGLFTVLLDFGNQFPGASRWLEIAVRTNGGGSFSTLSPRQPLTPAPYAITAGNVVSGGLTSGTYGNAVTFSNANNSFSGAFTGNGANVTNVNAAALNGLNASSFWQLGGNTISSGQFIGTSNNVAFDLYADDVRALRLILRTDASGLFSNAPNIIAGSSINQVSTGIVGGTVGGGGGGSIPLGTGYPNTVTADFGTVGGGINNNATGAGSVVGGGGFDGAAFFGNRASGPAAVVGGGLNNAASGSYATVAGGDNTTASGNTATAAGGLNTASGDYSTVGGGLGNTTGGNGSTIGGGGYDGTTTAGNSVQSKAATIGGGLGNSIPSGSPYAFIGGGLFNTNSGNSATVGGGFNNIASGNYATVAGGGINTASGFGATVVGGQNNTASGNSAVVVGGTVCTASGIDSLAAGTGANAIHGGAFVWADNASFLFSSTAANQFSVRSTGGVRFVTAIDGSGNPTAGVKLAPGDTAWSTISDRNAKKNFQPVDGEAVLEKLAAIPVEKWNYKWEADTNTPHFGPMAQDFKAAFYPGRDDKSITTLEFDGVELAAIQGLNQKLQEKDAEIQNLKQSVAELKQLVQALAEKK